MKNILNNSSLMWILIFVLFLSFFVIIALILKNKELKKNINNLNKYIKEQDENINNLYKLNKENKDEIIKVKEETKKKEDLIVEKIKEEKKEEKEKNSVYNNKEFKPSTIVPSQIDLNKEEVNKVNDKKEHSSSFDYMKEVSQKLQDASVPSTIELTDYEKKQEEEAIISYKELLENKDKIYNILDDEEDIDFIKELKSFRNDL